MGIVKIGDVDILAGWRDKRFVVLEYSLFGKWSVVLSDYIFWTQENDTLVEWCTDNGADMSGMVVEFPDEQTLLLFVLRWS
jgi:hypothetical protein